MLSKNFTPEWYSVSFVGFECWIDDVVDFVREIDVRVEHPHSIIVIIAHFYVFKYMVAEVNLKSGLKGVGAVVQKTSTFNLWMSPHNQF